MSSEIRELLKEYGREVHIPDFAKEVRRLQKLQRDLENIAQRQGRPLARYQTACAAKKAAIEQRIKNLLEMWGPAHTEDFFPTDIDPDDAEFIQ